jgi:hypothetical protein
MATGFCSCENPNYSNMGRPNCDIIQSALAFPILVPTFDDNGDLNTIDTTSATLGADIQALIAASTAANERLYPFPRVENATFERTDTVYDEAPSGTKVKLPNVGGVRTWAFELWGKNSSYELQRQLDKLGCSDFSVFWVDVTGNIWGLKDNRTDSEMYGYRVDVESFDQFRMFATDTTTSKIMVSWDIDQSVCESLAYAITPGELGYNATTLSANQEAFQTLTAVSATDITDVVYTGFGTAGNRDDVEGLVAGDFTAYNVTADAAIVISSVTESATTPGTYTIVIPAQTTSDVLRISISKSGFVVNDATVVAL